jgi:hypothetical protein
MAKDGVIKYNCAGITFINGNPLFKVMLMHKPYTNKYKIIVDGPVKEEFDARGWEEADKKYQETTKKYHQLIIK